MIPVIPWYVTLMGFLASLTAGLGTWRLLSSAATRSGLPAEAQRYVNKLEELTGVACAIVSTGSDRSETIVKNGSLVENWMAQV